MAEARRWTGDPRRDHEINRMLAMSELGRWEELDDAARRMIAETPDFYWAHLQLARAFEKRNRFEESRECCRTAIALNLQSSECFRTLAYASYRLQDRASAVEAARRAVALDPHDPWAHNSLALAAIAGASRPDRDLALSATNEAVRLAPGSPDLHVQRGWVLENLRRGRESRAAYRRALAMAPDSTGTIAAMSRGYRGIRPVRAARFLTEYARLGAGQVDDIPWACRSVVIGALEWATRVTLGVAAVIGFIAWAHAALPVRPGVAAIIALAMVGVVRLVHALPRGALRLAMARWDASGTIALARLTAASMTLAAFGLRLPHVSDAGVVALVLLTLIEWKVDFRRIGKVLAHRKQQRDESP